MARDEIRMLNYRTTTDDTVTTTDLTGEQQGQITSIQDFLVFKARQKGSSLGFDKYLALTKDQWDLLPKSAQTTWDTLSPDKKATILEPWTARPPRHPPPRPNNDNTSISLHDISAHNYLQVNFYDQLMGSATDIADHLKIDDRHNTGHNSQNS